MEAFAWPIYDIVIYISLSIAQMRFDVKGANCLVRNLAFEGSLLHSALYKATVNITVPCFSPRSSLPPKRASTTKLLRDVPDLNNLSPIHAVPDHRNDGNSETTDPDSSMGHPGFPARPHHTPWPGFAPCSIVPGTC